MPAIVMVKRVAEDIDPRVAAAPVEFLGLEPSPALHERLWANVPVRGHAEADIGVHDADQYGGYHGRQDHRMILGRGDEEITKILQDLIHEFGEH